MGERPGDCVVVLRPSDGLPHAARRLAGLLKSLGRRFGWRCISAQEIQGPTREAGRKEGTKGGGGGGGR